MLSNHLRLPILAFTVLVSACTKEQTSSANAPDPTMASPETTSGAHPDGSTEGANTEGPGDHTGTTPRPDDPPAAPGNPPTNSGSPPP